MARTDGYYSIEGIHDGLEADKHQLLRKVHLRMEIDDWYQSQLPIHVNQRALFFPAFWNFSQMDPKEKLSYFQIAGQTSRFSLPCQLELNSIQVSTESLSLLGMSLHRKDSLQKKATVRTTVSYSAHGTGLTCFFSRYLSKFSYEIHKPLILSFSKPFTSS